MDCPAAKHPRHLRPGLPTTSILPDLPHPTPLVATEGPRLEQTPWRQWNLVELVEAREASLLEQCRMTAQGVEHQQVVVP